MNSYQVFTAKIYNVGVIRYVDVPEEVSRALEAGGPHVAVRGEVEGAPLRTTLVSRRRGCYRMAVHGDIRKRLKVDTGAFVEVALERDDEPREPALPPALVLALRQSPKAQAEFRRMTTALRRQVVRYLAAVKQQATLERRIRKSVVRLEQKSRRKPKSTKQQ